MLALAIGIIDNFCSMMRWVVFIAVVLIVEWYAFQAIRLIDNTWFKVIYLLISAGSWIFLLVMFLLQPDRSVASGAKSLAIGFIIAMGVTKLLIVIFLLGEDIYRGFAFLTNKISGTDGRHFPSRRKFISTIAVGVAAIPFTGLIHQ